MTIDEARHIAKTTKSYTLKRDMLKYIKRKEREKWRTNKISSPSLARVWRENSDAKAA